MSGLDYSSAEEVLSALDSLGLITSRLQQEVEAAWPALDLLERFSGATARCAIGLADDLREGGHDGHLVAHLELVVTAAALLWDRLGAGGLLVPRHEVTFQVRRLHQLAQTTSRAYHVELREKNS